MATPTVPLQAEFDLFAREEQAARAAELQLKGWPADDPRRGQFAALLGDYVSVVKELRRLVRLSDRLQASLNQAKEELTLARARAEAGTRAKSVFLATMSHEMRTPLASVMATLELLAHPGATSADPAELLARAQDNAAALLGLIDDLLDYSKIEAERIELERVPVALRPMVESVRIALEPLAARKGLDLRVVVQEAVPPAILGDPTRLRQILVNLVGNAIKFTERGEVAIRLDGEPVGADGLTLVLEVADTGIGISEESRDRLFQPFSQAETTTTRLFGGTGLGLSICHRLATLMGGTIGVDSEPGRGSSFWVRLPTTLASIAQGPPLAVAPQVPVPAIHAVPSVGRPLPAVLVAEDDPSLGFLLCLHLEALGLAGKLVGTGVAAVEAALGGRYALLLCDMQMPVLDGPGAVSRIRAAEQERGLARLPIVALTGNVEALRRGGTDVPADVDAVLTKPVAQDRLGAVLSRWLAVSQPATAARPVVAGPDRSLFDPVPLRDAFAHLGAGAAEAVAPFGPQLRNLVQRTVDAAGTGDLTRLGEAAHALRGAALGTGAHRLGGLAGSLESAALRGDLLALSLARQLEVCAVDTLAAFDRFAAGLGRDTASDGVGPRQFG